MEGRDAFLDFKVVGPTIAELGAMMRRLDRAIEQLAGGKPVDKVTLSPTMTATSYKAQYGAGWPQ